MRITDTVLLGDIALSDAGYLETVARTARTGVQLYLGSEVGRPDLRVVNVYRDEAEVFAKSSLSTFSKIPITNDHPAKPVTAANWKDVAVGTTGDEVLRDGEYLKIGLKITDGAAVKAVQAGKRELSVGYSCELQWADGIAPDGTPYQARQTNITADHVAIVQRGRAGSRACIGDAWPTDSQTPEEKPMTLKTVTVDGIPVEVTDQGAIVIATLQQRLADAGQKLTAAEAGHATAIAAKDAELAKKDAALDDLKGKQLTDAQLDARVKARGDLIADAKAIVDADYSGKSDAEIRKAVVVAKLGDAAIAGKTEAYIDARFDILRDEAHKDPVRRHLSTTDSNPRQQTADHGQSAYEQRLSNAWKGEAK
ncbi:MULTISPECIES: DUF2213 domain-containing protein [unclassified Pseudomonas]|uniref:DUF2213 domain-containing protein n=1 Tax=unclassified Pseudomonas TaxID=196821 RepID=UPI000BCB4BF8|nr:MULTISPECIES: DUF2213 domain-containing protein [unclassified Pseudomonas]PVZ19932.1 hypothetical protein F474_00523 [Pseudomonas sp. URIL14HWK12:I12]PVZ26998.1 hypothetical protein F470_00178 [Pseudomonas sp. URIL14HWK12:I10]PVZ37887.1 hypothetical protein F472_00523 [Pseudomonas sp. URIL14HWK12:I11]SNZ05270.1 hypothetical protein SAMN05660463_00881 [Pseudomonas sp. URIL14HWK12:I9]